MSSSTGLHCSYARALVLGCPLDVKVGFRQIACCVFREKCGPTRIRHEAELNISARSHKLCECAITHVSASYSNRLPMLFLIGGSLHVKDLRLLRV